MNKLLVAIFVVGCLSSAHGLFTCPDFGVSFAPHPQTCSAFLFCISGALSVVSCDNLHFNPVTNECENPATAGCTVERDICPEEDDFQNPVLIPSSLDCNEYYICYSQTTSVLQCAPGLHFNPEKLHCESAHNAGCIIDNPDPGEIDVICPEDSDFIKLPHPTNCNKYFLCLGGRASLQQCAPDFYFDATNQRCDASDNVPCFSR